MHPVDESSIARESGLMTGLRYLISRRYNLLKNNGGAYARALMGTVEAVLTKESYIQYMKSNTPTSIPEPVVMSNAWVPDGKISVREKWRNNPYGI